MGYNIDSKIYDKAIELIFSGSIDYKHLGIDKTINNKYESLFEKRMDSINKRLKKCDIEISRAKKQLGYVNDIYLENYKLKEQIIILKKQLGDYE